MKNLIIFFIFIWVISGAKINGFSLKDKFFKHTEHVPYHADYYAVNGDRSIWPYVMDRHTVCSRYTSKAKNPKLYVIHGIYQLKGECFEDRKTVVTAEWDEVQKNVDKEDCMSGKIHVNDMPGFVTSPVIGDITAHYDNATYTCKKHYNAYCVANVFRSANNPELVRKDCKILQNAINYEQTIQKDFNSMKHDWNITVNKISASEFKSRTTKDYYYIVNLGR